MAATATRAKTNGGTKQAAASKRSSSSRRDEGTKLQLRYFKRMKPNRIYPLTVVVPGGKKRRDDDEPANGQLVVVRPVIAGAQITPAEQRFEIAPGNQITFYVTPLARGRLPRARLEVYAPGQPPETIPLPMKAKTQRLAIVLLLLAWLIPTCMIKLTKGDWKPGAGYLGDHFATPMEKDLPPIPVFNQPADWLPDGWKKFTIARGISDYLVLGYAELGKAMDMWRWLPNAVAAGFIFLAFVSWLFHKPARKSRKVSIDLADAGAASDGGVELQPI